jgi:hypothetical protein
MSSKVHIDFFEFILKIKYWKIPIFNNTINY